MNLSQSSKKFFLDLSKSKRVFLEGNILKILKNETNDKDFNEYLKKCIEKDTASRKKRLKITQQVQDQNKELLEASIQNEKLTQDLQTALEEAEKAKTEAEKLRDNAVEDLELLQQKTQFELVGQIVRVALLIIGGVGIVTSAMYALAITYDNETQIIGPAWSNMFSILLTNTFSIVGTIMGVKYATEKEK